MALRAVESYLSDHNATYTHISHPTTDDSYVMIITQMSVEPHFSKKSRFTWFKMCDKDGMMQTLLEEQGVKNVEYFTVLQST
ncbi:hypothetical protein BS47DRAFT_1338084 [Hydnum rufescens UP504]|uniref:Uncharacterized protein n=1 Tax=Hydnum rufescens UP504 TaxID=1448309 RepID=A0A9P6B7E4_9AGAM|nr:hypothetical protein BS47DRAFT_1338084 [Hydnum rufescens UP504]